MNTYLLVHGGGHAGWFWDSTVAALRSRGHEARAFDLPGRDGQPDHVTLDDWVERIGQEVDLVLGSGGRVPVLVAHSMGGLSVSQFAERRPKYVRSIIYVCAVVPQDGSTGLATLAEAGANSLLLHDGSLLPTPDGKAVRVAPSIAASAFYGRCDASVVQEAVRRLCAEPVGPMSTPLSLGSAFHSVRKSWIAASEDRTVPHALQLQFAERCGAALTTIVADHSPNYSAPTEFVELLDRLA